jgi:hypothetical protein
MDNQKIRVAIEKCMEVIKQDKKIQRVFFKDFHEVYMNDSLVEIAVGKFIVRYEYCFESLFVTVSTRTKKGWLIERYDSQTYLKLEDGTYHLND